MYFSDDPEDRKYEKLMRLPPYHRSRGYGVYVFDRRKPTIILCGVETPIEDTPLAILLLETAKAIGNAALYVRISNYLLECEESTMVFKNQIHQALFERAMQDLRNRNHAFVAAVYLLTSQPWIWHRMQSRVTDDNIRFEDVRLTGCSEINYTLFCCAKDIYVGTKHIGVRDLADPLVIPPEIFGVICNALAIARYGLLALKMQERKYK